MSSLFSKLKALVQSGARGPRRKKKAAQAPASVAEVTEATARRRIQDEVSQASPAQVARPKAAVRKPAAAEAEPDEEQAGALEEERVVDLLKGKQT